MTIRFISPTSVADLTGRATAMLEEGAQLAALASHLADFERATGRKLFVSEADQGTSHVGQGTFANYRPEFAFPLPKPEPEETRLPDAALTVAAPLGEVESQVERVTESAPAPEPIKSEKPAAAAPSASKPARDQEPVKKAATPKKATASTGRRPALVKKPAPVAAPKPQAPVATAQPPQKPQPATRPLGSLNLIERDVVKHLERLPDTFTPAEDLTIAELLIGGNKIEAVAMQLEVSPADALARWKGFLCDEILGANGFPSIDGQKQLLNALRYRQTTAAA
ncbi:hypothetical protein [Thioclava sp.]|uniref:hypothetical protein n=1 Tax=Thioclava sp. TaxID=1933450 RepID=UPI003241C0DB